MSVTGPGPSQRALRPCAAGPARPGVHTAAGHGTLSITKGNVFAISPAGAVAQLTTSGKDRAPTRSPDGRYVAFVRKSANKAYLAAGGEEDYPGEAILADQLWVLETKTGRERMLVADRQPQFGDTTRELTKTIAGDVAGRVRPTAHLRRALISRDIRRLKGTVSAGTWAMVTVSGSRNRGLTEKGVGEGNEESRSDDV